MFGQPFAVLRGLDGLPLRSNNCPTAPTGPQAAVDPPQQGAGMRTYWRVMAQPPRARVRQGAQEFIPHGLRLRCHFVDRQYRAVGGTPPERDRAAHARLGHRG